jgi:hypothetical protein
MTNGQVVTDWIMLGLMAWWAWYTLRTIPARVRKLQSEVEALQAQLECVKSVGSET